MASETQIGNLVIDLQIKTNALEKGLEITKQGLQKLEQQNKQVENSNKSLDASFVVMSAGIIATMTKVTGVIKDAVDEYKEYTQAMSSLQNVSEYTGQSMSDFSEIMDEFSTYMTKSDLATTIKNFSLMGMTAEQTRKMIEALTNSAIRNRNANYTVSEAVKVASDGYKQGLSTLSDSAGVTENLSVMLDNYAKSIGKTASQLTEAEKNQAYLNRTMYAAEPFAGAMSEYMDTLAGKQGQYSQAVRETQVAYAESIEPMLAKFEEFKTQIVSGLGDIISSNEGATAGITVFITTLGTLTIGIIAVKKAYDIYKASTIASTVATQGFTAALAANPLGAAAIAISLVVSALVGYKTAVEQQSEAQAVLNERTQQYNDILANRYGYSEKAITDAEQRKTEIEQEITYLNQIIQKRQELQTLQLTNKPNSDVVKNAKNQINDLIEKYEELSKKTVGTNEESRKSINELSKELSEYKKYLSEADAVKKISKGLDTETIKKQQQEAAQLKVNVQNMQAYLNTVKKGNTSTTEYQNAVKELAKTYPEAANAEGIIINQAQNLIDAETLKADTAWNASQDTINSYISMLNAALQSESVQKQVAQNIGIAFEDVKPKLQGVLNLLQTMAGYQAKDVPNVQPVSRVTTPRSSGASSYSNKRLDNYKKEIEHKKALDQISLQDEINMYQTALNRYAKTQDEKWELQEKIYSLQKELQEKELTDYTQQIEHRKALDQITLQEEIAMYNTALNQYAKTTEKKQELREKLYELNKELAQKEKETLDQQTQDYENYIEEQKVLQGAGYTVEKQTSDYDKIIRMHKNYLDQIMKDERLGLEERKSIYREELSVIRDYEQKKRDLRIQSIDNTASQLTSAITKKLQEMQNKEKELLDENLSTVESWKSARIDAINEEYDERIEAIERELAALDKAEQQKTRAEEDAEYEKKKLRLEQLVEFEHDATTKANYQKELDKLVTDHQKTLDKRALSDKKDALNEQKELLKNEQDSKIQQIELETEKRKEEYDKQLKALEEHYDKQIAKAEETAQTMLLNVEQNQNQILELLQSYGDAYEITGQTFGEKLGQSFADTAMEKVQNAISRIQTMIDSAIASNISRLSQSVAKIEGSGTTGNTTINKTVNVEQNNTITAPVDSPSVLAKKQETLNRDLADSIARVF